MYLMENPLKRVKMACIKNPLINFETSSCHTVKELLLSTFAIGDGIDRNEIEKAIDELIDLHYPLINEILEVAAYLCTTRKLFIYCANETEWKSLKSKPLEVGHFDKVYNLIILSTDLPLSEVLIHELIHAVRYYVLNSNLANKLKPPVTVHRKFCKNSFLSFFKSIQQNPTDSLDSERKTKPEIITEAEIKNDEILEISPERISRKSEIIQFKESIRKKLCSSLKMNDEKEQSEEFLPNFIDSFVKYACHEKIPSLQTIVDETIAELKLTLDSEDITAEYNARLLEILYSALPNKIIDDFLKDNFRDALNNYLWSVARPSLSGKVAIYLKDNDTYSSLSNAEPKKINMDFC